MPQFFIKESDIVNGRCEIAGDDFHHLTRVRRVRAGDSIDLRNESGEAISARIAVVSDTRIIAEILERKPSTAPCADITLCAAVLKGKKFDLVVQKAVEIGVRRIVPVITERTIPLGRDEKKRDRWEKIAAEAAKQCMRKDMPDIDEVTPFAEALISAKTGIGLLAHPGRGGSDLKDVLASVGTGDNVAVMTGPEGGFSNREIEGASRLGWIPFIFGFTSLRAETAAIVFPAVIAYELGRKSGNRAE